MLRLAVVAIGVVLGSTTVVSAPERSEDSAKRTVLAVIVHPARKVDGLTTAELRNIFLKQKTRWPDGDPILTLNWPPGSAPRVAFDRQALKMSQSSVAQFWVDQRIRGRGKPPPRSVFSSSVLQQIVSRNIEAISFIPLADVRKGVRIVRVDGLAPSDPEYPLQLKESGP